MKFNKLILQKFRKKLSRKFDSPQYNLNKTLTRFNGKILNWPVQGQKPSKIKPVIPTIQALITTETQPVIIPLPPLPAVSQPTFMTTAELIQPNEPLQHCIEGFLLNQRSPHTQKAYGKDLKRFIKFLQVRKYQYGLEKLDRRIVITYKDSLQAEGLEHSTIDRHLATLKSFFGWLYGEELIAKNPAEGVKFLNPKRLSKTNGFTDEEVRKILEIPDLHMRTGSLHYAVLMVLFYCGLRRSELCSLRTIHFGEERTHRVLKLRGKGNTERLIVLIPPVWNALKHYFLITRKSFAEDQHLFTPLKNNRTKTKDRPLDPSSIFYIVTRYAKLAGITKRVSPHSCRATAISNARDHNVPDRAIQEFAGWASPDMITRYDKRKASLEHSAAHSIFYGNESKKKVPEVAVGSGMNEKVIEGLS